MAAANGVSEGRILDEAVQLYWVRWGCRARLKAGEW
jgi:hypothetical protein